MPKDNLTAERLRELLHYDPQTGHFRWRVNRQGRYARAGKIAGTRGRNGYRRIRVGEAGFFYAHRLAFLWMTGAWPKREIDHKNLNPEDNRFSNLREATRGQQHYNTRVRRDSKLGIKGVAFVPHLNKTNRYSAVIKADGRRLNLGYFKTPEEAHAAYAEAAAKLHGEFARMQ